MQRRFDRDKLDELKHKLQPGKSWWALVGIVIFFFLPEIAAFFYGNEITHYFEAKALSTNSYLKMKLFEELKSLGENSYFNIALGIIFTVWFFKARKS